MGADFTDAVVLISDTRQRFMIASVVACRRHSIMVEKSTIVIRDVKFVFFPKFELRF